MEWIVIAAIVLLMVASAIEIWQGAWGSALNKATAASSAFETALAGL